jgi:hypothetical protein
MQSVLAIGAVNSSESFFQFYSYDQRVKPDVMAQGVSAVLSNQFGNIVTANGTSFLVPSWQVWLFLLAGIRKQIKKSELIIQSADRYTAPTAQYGYGIPDFSAV